MRTFTWRALLPLGHSRHLGQQRGKWVLDSTFDGVGDAWRARRALSTSAARDIEGGADAFLGFGGIAVREKVEKGADWFVK